MSAHILAPSSEGLFHRAIMQSGSIFTFGTSDSKEATAAVLEGLGVVSHL